MLRGHVLDEATLEADVAVAVQTTERQGFAPPIASATEGNAELLLEAAGEYDVPARRSATLRRAKAVLLDAAEGGWRCGNQGMAETPGLMSGLAGIGYGLLRLEDPASVPSVVVLDCPR